jgi:hypothetical protein
MTVKSRRSHSKAERIRSAIEELRRIEVDILFDKDDHGEQELPLAIVEEFKSVVDNLRSSTWCYLQCRKEHSTHSVAELTRHYRMRRVVEMLREARTGRKMKPDDAGDEATLSLLKPLAKKSVKPHAL